MAMRSFGVDVSGDKAVTEGALPTALFAAVQTATTDALAVSGLDAVTGATTAVTAIGTASAAVETAVTAKKVTVLINGSLTKAQLAQAFANLLAHVNTCNVYS
jgi:hypothetical protein